MRPILLIILIFLLTLAPLATVSAAPAPASSALIFQDSTPPPDDSPDPGVRPSVAASGSPWLGIAFFVLAAAGYIYFKSRLPANTVTTNCCASLIDPVKMEAEKKRFAEEER